MAQAPMGVVQGSGMGGVPIADIVRSAGRSTGAFMQGLGNKKAAKEYAKNYNQYMNNRGMLIAEGGGGQTGMQDVLKAYNSGQSADSLGGLIGALAKNGQNIFGPQKTTTDTSGTNYSNTAYNNLTSPEWEGANKGVLGQQRNLVKSLQDRASGNYQNQVLNAARQAANAAEISKGREMGALSRRGINPAQAGVLPSRRALNQQILDIQTNLPEQFRNADMAQAANFLNMTKATRQKGTSNTTGGFNQSSTTLSPADYEKLLRFLMPPSPQQGTAGMGTSNFGNIVSGFLG